MKERQRRYRKRRARGQVVYKITADDRLLNALIEAGRLAPEQTASRELVEVQLDALVNRWVSEFVT